jgi:murein L,D-transpeptidase YafK
MQHGSKQPRRTLEGASRSARAWLACAAAAVATACLAMLPIAPASAGPLAELQTQRADKILVLKSERKLLLLSRGEVLRSIEIALGLQPVGHKQQEGDFRTPEGAYRIEAKNSASDYFLSLKVSYPNSDDRARARSRGVDPGGQIMIHGLPNDPRREESYYHGWDWTDGCIAVSNSDMVDIWLMTSVSTPIEIRP